MLCMKKSNHGLSQLTLFIFFLSLFLTLSFSTSAQCSEKTYTVTETQLTTLEQNLTELKKQNQTLEIQLENSKSQIQSLKKQVTKLTNSLENANQSLNKLEDNMSDKNQHSIGIGIGNNGISYTADIKNTWIYADKDTFAIGVKYKFYL